jgi:hypothetical protein
LWRRWRRRPCAPSWSWPENFGRKCRRSLMSLCALARERPKSRMTCCWTTDEPSPSHGIVRRASVSILSSCAGPHVRFSPVALLCRCTPWIWRHTRSIASGIGPTPPPGRCGQRTKRAAGGCAEHARPPQPPPPVPPRLLMTSAGTPCPLELSEGPYVRQSHGRARRYRQRHGYPLNRFRERAFGQERPEIW